MFKRAMASAVTLMGLGVSSSHATAANYTVDCGSGGPMSLVQNQLAAITGKGNTLTVTGTCGGGDLSITGVDSLSIAGLSVQGQANVTLTGATHISFTGLTLSGNNSSIGVADHSTVSATNTVLSGWLQVAGNSSVTFNTLTADGGVVCWQGSDCRFNSTTLRGVPSGDPTLPNIGIQAASGARVNFGSGRITGFDWGVHVWNHATAFFNPVCDPLIIDSNASIGVYVRYGGVVKLEGAAPPIPASCWAAVYIVNNGNYGLLAEGGGEGFLYRADVLGHATDGIRVQSGSVVKVRSSNIDAATNSGRSAWVKSQSHLWFDEEIHGPTASTSLAGPVCVTNNSSVDADNSSTVVTTITSCSN
jgi:hypothetical protein